MRATFLSPALQFTHLAASVKCIFMTRVCACVHAPLCSCPASGHHWQGGGAGADFLLLAAWSMYCAEGFYL